MPRWSPKCKTPRLTPNLCAELSTDLMSSHSKAKNLDELSKLGHFLKGSSATLGFNQVRDECEKIQHYGHMKNETGEVDEPDENKCLRLISDSLDNAKKAYEAVNALMKQYYEVA